MKGTDFVGVERNRVTIAVTVIGGIGSDVGCEERDQNRESEEQRRELGPSHGAHTLHFLSCSLFSFALLSFTIR